MVYRPSKGSYEIDRVIRPIGRVRLRTGTNNKRVAERYELMLDDIPLEVVRMLQDHVLTLREVYDLWSRGETKLLPSAQQLRPLVAEMRQWARTHEQEVSEGERRKRLALIALVEQHPGARVHDLPRLVSGLRETYRDRGSQFNHLRTICQAFVRDTLGVRSELHRRVSEVRTLATPPRYVPHHCTVQEAKQIRDSLPGRWGADWWAMCCSGMGPKEYFEDGWKVLPIGIEVYGLKKGPRGTRYRIVPLIVAPVKGGSIDGFEAALYRAGLGVTPYDARRTYARWLEELRLPAYRRSGYLGHGPKSMTELYGMGDLRTWLSEDAGVIRQYVGEPVRLKVQA